MTKFLEKATIYSAAGDLAVVVYVKERSMPHTRRTDNDDPNPGESKRFNDNDLRTRGCR